MTAIFSHCKRVFPLIIVSCVYAATLFMLSGCSEEEIASAIVPEIVQQMHENDSENDADSDQEPDDENDRQNEEPEPKIIPEEIHDPDRSPDTILATVDDKKIVLQDVYDEFTAAPAAKRNELKMQQHRLLESLVEGKMMTLKAKELGIDETDIYKETRQELEKSPMADNVPEEQIESIALMEALLLSEVVEKADLSEEKLKEVYSSYKHFLPLELDFEEVKDEIKKLIVRDQITQYIQSLQVEYSVDIDTDWVQEKKAKAAPQKNKENNNGKLDD